jgi:ankyrin repeat protein
MPSESGSAKIVKLLLMREDVNINSKNKHGQTPFSCAIRGRDADLVKLLLMREDVDVNSKDEQGHTPLWHAVTRRYVLSGSRDETPELLLSHPRVKVNIRDNLGRTPLSEAAANGDIEMVELLLSHGAAADKRDYFGLTPRLRAQYCSRRGAGHISDIVKLLDASRSSWGLLCSE